MSTIKEQLWFFSRMSSFFSAHTNWVSENSHFTPEGDLLFIFASKNHFDLGYEVNTASHRKTWCFILKADETHTNKKEKKKGNIFRSGPCDGKSLSLQNNHNSRENQRLTRLLWRVTDQAALLCLEFCGSESAEVRFQWTFKVPITKRAVWTVNVVHN